MHLGLECLQATQQLVQHAVQASATIDSPPFTIVMGQEIVRLAVSETQTAQLQDTAQRLPHFCTWMDHTTVHALYPETRGTQVMGALRMDRGGAMVIHVPSYLQGLWQATQQLAQQHGIPCEWNLADQSQSLVDTLDWSAYDIVVLAAGAGLLQDTGLWPESESQKLPIQLVRGQSAIVQVQQQQESKARNEAILCGKYMTPLPQNDLRLIGATHEFRDTPLGRDQVIQDLRGRIEAAVPHAWNGSVAQITEGFRVQSERGRFGRLPILGKFPSFDEGVLDAKRNTWIFTGLSSRGLLYHALFGELLARAILANDEDIIRQEAEQLLWWK